MSCLQTNGWSLSGTRAVGGSGRSTRLGKYSLFNADCSRSVWFTLLRREIHSKDLIYSYVCLPLLRDHLNLIVNS